MRNGSSLSLHTSSGFTFLTRDYQWKVRALENRPSWIIKNKHSEKATCRKKDRIIGCFLTLCDLNKNGICSDCWLVGGASYCSNGDLILELGTKTSNVRVAINPVSSASSLLRNVLALTRVRAHTYLCPFQTM